MFLVSQETKENHLNLQGFDLRRWIFDSGYTNCIFVGTGCTSTLISLQHGSVVTNATAPDPHVLHFRDLVH